MPWLMLGSMAANGIMQARQAERQQQAQKASNLAQAEMTRFSPWTGMKGQLDMSSHPDALGAGVGGAMQGMAAGQSLQNAFAGPATTPTAPPDQSGQPNYFGGRTLAANLDSGYGRP